MWRWFGVLRSAAIGDASIDPVYHALSRIHQLSIASCYCPTMNVALTDVGDDAYCYAVQLYQKHALSFASLAHRPSARCGLRLSPTGQANLTTTTNRGAAWHPKCRFTVIYSWCKHFYVAPDLNRQHSAWYSHHLLNCCRRWQG
jgi:hypothetical protein